MQEAEKGSQSNKVRSHVYHTWGRCLVCTQAKRRLEFGWMIVAWDNYALAAAATGQLKYRAAMGHKAVVLSVAALAPAENRSGLLALLYNELCMCVEPH